MADCINTESDFCILEVKFFIQTKKSDKFIAVYSCKIARSINAKLGHGFFSESLSVSKQNDDGDFGRMNPFFNYSINGSDESVFGPKNKYDAIIQQNQQRLVKCLLAKEMSIKEPSSFLFSYALHSLILSSEEKQFAEVISFMSNYAKFSLFTILNSHSGFISIDAVIPLAIKHKFQGGTTIGDIPIKQQGSVVSDIATFKVIKTVLNSMDCVIKALVPGLSIDTIEYGNELQKNGSEGILYEVVSIRNGKSIPIRYESEGIRKLLSILNLIIAAYNNPSICIAIDELDAGIFEILLGDLLKVFLESGKGQLIFTSHNLRPLEVLGKDNIIFTTANPNNRYIQLKNIRPTNNLRDCYLRALNLGGQDEELATETDTVTIRRALRKAGIINA